MNPNIRPTAAVIGTFAVLAIATGIFVWSGSYNIGADSPHLPITLKVINNLRDHSTKAHSRGIKVPNLDNPAMIAEGAEHYSSMCTGCHLAPGMAETEIRAGLYPLPPDLSKDGIDDPAEAFWIIKHGIKMTGMAAWGKTHTDEQIWNMVAFIRKLPTMTPGQYLKLGGKLPVDDDEHMHAAMGGKPGDMDMPGMQMGSPLANAPKAPAETPTTAPSQITHRHTDGTIESHPAMPAEPEKDPGGSPIQKH